MGGKPRGDDASLVAVIAACEPWDERREFVSKVARTRAWSRHVKRARAAARAIEELARRRRHDALVGLLEHPAESVRASAAAVLLGFHTAEQGRRPATWPRADRGAIGAVAALLGPDYSETDRWAVRARFILDRDAAIAALIAALTPASLERSGGPQRVRDMIDALPDDVGDRENDWYEAAASSLSWVSDSLAFVIIGHLEKRAPRYLIAALALALADRRFDRLMARVSRIEHPDRDRWLAEVAGAAGLDPRRAARLRTLAGLGAPLTEPPIAALEPIARASWDGGPMALLPAALAPAWEGGDPPGAGRVVQSDHRWDDPAAPATDYDLACEKTGPGRAALLPVGDGAGLITPTPFAAVVAASGIDGFLVIVEGAGELIGRWALSPEGWRELGDMVIDDDGSIWLQSAALRGGDAPGVRFAVAPGTYAVDELAFCDERGELHLVRARRR